MLGRSVKKAANEFPNVIYARTWIVWACAIIIGYLVGMAGILGPLFWLDVLKSANGAPGHTGGIPLTIFALVFAPMEILFIFHVYARQRPLITMNREGLCIREIGSRTRIPYHPLLSIFRLNFFIVLFYSTWDVLSLRTFRVETICIRWENVIEFARGDWSVYICGVSMQDTKTTFEPHDAGVVVTFSYGADAFGISAKKAGQSIEHYLRSHEARQTLPGWGEKLQ